MCNVCVAELPAVQQTPRKCFIMSCKAWLINFNKSKSTGGIIMKKPSVRKTFIYSLIFFISSCVTINIYFPAAAVEKAAERIVGEVWGEEEKEQPEEGQGLEGEPQSSIVNSMWAAISVLGPREAHAQNADINVTTPAIRALMESIKKRSQSIKPFMDRGNIGIGNTGLLVFRNNDGLNLKDKAQLKRLIAAENQDRNSLYSEFAKANKFAPDKISEIKRIFAKIWMKNARQGWWVQDPAGNWMQK